MISVLGDATKKSFIASELAGLVWDRGIRHGCSMGDSVERKGSDRLLMSAMLSSRIPQFFLTTGSSRSSRLELTEQGNRGSRSIVPGACKNR